LGITKSQFSKMSTNGKLDVLFDNQLTTIDLIDGYKFYYKITAIIGAFLVGGMGILFKAVLF